MLGIVDVIVCEFERDFENLTTVMEVRCVSPTPATSIHAHTHHNTEHNSWSLFFLFPSGLLLPVAARYVAWYIQILHC